jgi:hypothetical protein
MIDRHLLWPREHSEEAGHSEINSAEPIANQIRAAVGEFAVEPVQLRFEL